MIPLKALISSDWHFTSKPADAYRWGLFPWLAQQINKHACQALLMGGDLTDAKDRHPASLVNRIVDAFALLSKQIPYAEIIILKGNHDYKDAACPFFQLLSQIPGITYVSQKQIVTLGLHNILCVPHSVEGVQGQTFTKRELACELLFTHQTFSGAVASSGVKLEGESQRGLQRFKGHIISGDIHVPQQLKRVTYVGSPYRIRFNDAFNPRVLLYDGGSMKDLIFPCLKRWTLTIRHPKDLLDCGTRPGDQVKIRVQLLKSQFSEWAVIADEVRRVATSKPLLLLVHAVELLVDAPTPTVKRRRLIGSVVPEKTALKPAVIVKKFCKQEGISEFCQAVGLEILKNAH